MINIGTGNTEEEAGANKAAGKAVLAALVDAWRATEGDEPLTEVSVAAPDLVAGTWQLDTCRTCGGRRETWRPEGCKDLWALCCPECWGLELLSGDTTSRATASQSLARILSRLPPGSKVTAIKIAGKTITIDPPVDPHTEERDGG